MFLNLLNKFAVYEPTNKKNHAKIRNNILAILEDV